MKPNDGVDYQFGGESSAFEERNVGTFLLFISRDGNSREGAGWAPESRFFLHFMKLPKPLYHSRHPPPFVESTTAAALRLGPHI